MYYLSFQGHNARLLSVSNDKATIVSEAPIGESLITFYNYYNQYRTHRFVGYEIDDDMTLAPCSDDFAEVQKREIVFGLPLTALFYEQARQEQILESDDIDAACQAVDEDYALTKLLNQIQYAYSDLHVALSAHPGMENDDAKKFQQAAYLFTHCESDENDCTVFVPNRFNVSFVLLDGKVMQVYAVKSLYDYLALDFYHTFFWSDNMKKVCICPTCRTAFRAGYKNKVYCSKKCKDDDIEKSNSKSSYYRKYRYLRQYHNRKLNNLRSMKTDSDAEVQRMQKAYDAWVEWARQEFETATKKYEAQKNAKLDELSGRGVNPYRINWEIECESVENFGERLKSKWKQLLEETK